MKMNRKIKKALILGAVCGAVLGMALTFAAASKALDKKEDTMANLWRLRLFCPRRNQRIGSLCW